MMASFRLNAEPKGFSCLLWVISYRRINGMETRERRVWIVRDFARVSNCPIPVNWIHFIVNFVMRWTFVCALKIVHIFFLWIFKFRIHFRLGFMEREKKLAERDWIYIWYPTQWTNKIFRGKVTLSPSSSTKWWNHFEGEMPGPTLRKSNLDLMRTILFLFYFSLWSLLSWSWTHWAIY